MNRWKKSRDNRGMSLVMVIGTVALVSILVVIDTVSFSDEYTDEVSI